MGLVLGIGSGLFSLIVIWMIGFVAIFLMSRASGPIKNGMIPLVLFLIMTTLVLVFYPRKTLNEELQADSQDQDVDRLAIPRIVLFSFVCLFALIGLLFFMQHMLEPIYSPAVTAKRIYTF